MNLNGKIRNGTVKEGVCLRSCRYVSPCIKFERAHSNCLSAGQVLGRGNVITALVLLTVGD